MTVSKKFSVLRQYINDIYFEEMANLEEISDDICRAMDDPKRTFTLPSPLNEELSPIATDALNALVLRLIKKIQILKECLK